jgi:hypothetical protein
MTVHLYRAAGYLVKTAATAWSAAALEPLERRNCYLREDVVAAIFAPASRKAHPGRTAEGPWRPHMPDGNSISRVTTIGAGP